MEADTMAEEISKFQSCVLKRRWHYVTAAYKSSSDFHKIKISESRGTALHVAVNDGMAGLVEILVDAILEHEGTEALRDDSALRSTNERGDTPLHLAASRGFIRMCISIIGESGERKDLIKVLNKTGESPLFRAVLTGQTNTFVYLYHVSKDLEVRLANNYGDSIFCAAIRGEFLDLAIMIDHCYRDELVSIQNNSDGVTDPLKVLACKPKAFKSGSSLSWWKRILYYCIHIERRDAAKAIRSYIEKIEREDQELKVKIEVAGKKAYAHNIYGRCGFVKSVVRLAFKGLLSISGLGAIFENLKALRNIRHKHTWARQLLDILMDKPYYKYNYESRAEGDCKEKFTPFLAAAKNGIVEIVLAFQSEIEIRAYETNSKEENMLIVAVKNRQTKVVEMLKKHWDKQLFDSLILEVNDKDCTVLHLAAGTSGNRSSWLGGAALQMMWDIKWYQYVRSLVPEYLTSQENEDCLTADQVFAMEHEGMVKESSEWIKETSNSCSVVAGLIAAVSFETSSTVADRTTRGKQTFDVFGVASLVGLYFSLTALLMFLAIFNSRKEIQDFRRSLPLKLLFGLSSLFFSIISMLVSFCSAHSFELKEKYKSIFFPAYIVACLPVTLYAALQFPLYIDLLKAVFTKVPKPSISGSQF